MVRLFLKLVLFVSVICTFIFFIAGVVSAIDTLSCTQCQALSHSSGTPYIWDTNSGSSCSGALSLGWPSVGIQEKWCCGDDTANIGGTWVGEFYRTCKSASGGAFSCDSMKGACCYDGGSCAYNGACFSSGAVHNVKSSGNDKVAWCGGSNDWLDLDSINYGPPDNCANEYSCASNMWCSSAGFSWIFPGELSSGEYNALYLRECCGDDSSENVRSRVSGTDAPSGYINDSSDIACCDSSTDCIKTKTCTTSGSAAGTIPTSAYCNSGTWQGGDASLAACNAVAGNSRWIIGGEVTSSCCGDDSSENALTRICASGVCTSNSGDDGCCDLSSDCLYNNTCYATGTSVNIAGAADLEYCDAGTWRDCNTNAQCPSGAICSSGTCVAACTITDVSVTPSCGSDGLCNSGESLSVSVSYVGDCSAGDNVQVDLFGGCSIGYSGANLSGINWNAQTTGSSVSSVYTIPQLPYVCSAKTIVGYSAAIRDGGVPGVGTIIASRSATISSFNFVTLDLMLCGSATVGGGGSVDACARPTPRPFRYCASDTDCVYANEITGAAPTCYALGSSRLNKDSHRIVCSNSQTWCPENYKYELGSCVYARESCTPVCSQVVNDYLGNSYFGNSACLRNNASQACCRLALWPEIVTDWQDAEPY